MIRDNSNLEIYNDPINYDLECGDYDPEGTILLEMARQANGCVLELGCGTGRVTIPLAERGIELIGLDVLPHLIEYAWSRSKHLPIDWICQDVNNFQLGRQFPLIFTKGAVFNHLVTLADQEAMLSRVRDHLAPDGKFILDVGYKHPNKMLNVSKAEEWYTFEDSKGREVQVYGTDRYDHLQQIWYQTSFQRWEENGRIVETKPVQLALRYFMPQEIEALLHYNGFKILSRFGSWKGGPMTEDEFTHVYVCTHEMGKDGSTDEAN